MPGFRWGDPIAIALVRNQLDGTGGLPSTGQPYRKTMPVSQIRRLREQPSPTRPARQRRQAARLWGDIHSRARQLMQDSTPHTSDEILAWLFLSSIGTGASGIRALNSAIRMCEHTLLVLTAPQDVPAAGLLVAWRDNASQAAPEHSVSLLAAILGARPGTSDREALRTFVSDIERVLLPALNRLLPAVTPESR